MSSGSVTIRQVRRGKGYESISRDSLQNRRLSFKARGLMAMLKSLPDEWECNGIQGLADMSDKDGYEAVNTGLKELEAEGHLARLKRHGTAGQWDWLWVHSDDPADVADAVEQWGQAVPRGGNKGARGRPDQHPNGPAEDTMTGKPEHGSMTGKSVDGSPVHGEPPNKEVVREEIYSREEPGGVGLVNAGASDEPAPAPAPPTPEPLEGDPRPPYDPANPRCREHRSVPVGERGPNCAACGRTREWQEARGAADTAAVAASLRACSMCDAEGTRVDDRRVPLSPYQTCDHVTPSSTVLAEIRSAEAAAEKQPRAAALVTHSSPAAMALIRSVLSNRAVTKSNTGSDFPDTGEAGHTTEVHAASG